jgi:hypothetical protein
MTIICDDMEDDMEDDSNFLRGQEDSINYPTQREQTTVTSVHDDRKGDLNN